MSRVTEFRDPADYVETLEKFMESDMKAVKLNGTLTREDAAVFRMAVFCKDLPIEVRIDKGVIVFVKEAR